ncbi:hypothetical protein FF011L_22250 [Roseimaritima multifibrata]|uniref:Uncharacterized protein n=1 Tax=Roseimaritima multifibrata TaxID=1930274 RepID=A0A517MEZ3_9BACT|nr:hypothetical protein FF011L_22250 [Roseimaritima multifibrata]
MRSQLLAERREPSGMFTQEAQRAGGLAPNAASFGENFVKQSEWNKICAIAGGFQSPAILTVCHAYSAKPFRSA